MFIVYEGRNACFQLLSFIYPKTIYIKEMKCICIVHSSTRYSK